MFYHIVLTTKCNSQCRYCYGKSVDDIGCDFELDTEEVASDVQYSIDDLKKFITKEDYVTFYGGEPLLRMDLIKEIIDKVDAKGFMMQTNGLLLDKFDYLDKIDVLLVSIDGDKELTDYNRGEGTYDLVLKNIKGYKGELIARMTVTEDTDIFNSVKHLLDVGFKSVHWQIDANFWHNDYEKRNFKEWSEKYNLGIKKLIRFWADEIKKGNVIKLYPILGVFNSI